jgi:hypothetical protein
MLRMGGITTKGHPLQGSPETPTDSQGLCPTTYLGRYPTFPPQEHVSRTLRSVPEH